MGFKSGDGGAIQHAQGIAQTHQRSVAMVEIHACFFIPQAALRLGIQAQFNGQRLMRLHRGVAQMEMRVRQEKAGIDPAETAPRCRAGREAGIKDRDTRALTGQTMRQSSTRDACAKDKELGLHGASFGAEWHWRKAEESMDQAQQIIAELGLQPHPEGGWYRETWKGTEVAGRAVGTAIYFLLKAGERSHWHRVDAGEVWLWHAGSPLDLRMAEGDEGPVVVHRLGPDVLMGERPQAVVPAGWWQATEAQDGWALVSCCVAPGFRFEGFELAPPGFAIAEQ